MTPQRPPEKDKRAAPPGRGETTAAHDQSFRRDEESTAIDRATPVAEPQLPHELDESRHSQAPGAASQADVGRQAARDLERGLEDTGKGPVLDEVYNRDVAPDRGDSKPRR